MDKAISSPIDLQKRIMSHRAFLRYHSKKYYVDCKPEITDNQYDIVLRGLIRLEELSDEPIPSDSPTQVVGSDLHESYDE